jgi:hypothetical protein
MALNAQQRRMAQLIYSTGRQRGLSNARARELVAASYAESGLNPTIRNKSSGATGLFQLLSSGYVNRANQMGGAANPRANLLSILPDYLSYWRSHPGAAPGQAAAAVERSGEGAGFYANPLKLLGNLGGGNVPAGVAPAPAPAGGMAQVSGPNLRPLKLEALQQLLSQTGAKHPDYSGFLEAIRNLRTTQAQGSAQQLTAPSPAAGAAPSPSGAGLKFSGVTLKGLQPSFLRSFSAAVHAAGGTQVRLMSGYRSPAHNAAVGGVSHSNHLTGTAVDAEVYVPGRGWVPAGTALRGVAGRYGLRSGDTPGFYRGGRDPVHVDSAANQR